LTADDLSAFKQKQPMTSTIVDDHFQAYLSLAQLRTQSSQNQTKLARLEQQITAELLAVSPDFQEVECKIREFELTEHDEQQYVLARLMQAASKDWMQRLDNHQLQQLLVLDRIEQLLERLAKLEIDAF
jgi:hypothetical protein